MDILTFVVEMTKALAWPSSVVLLSLVLRKPLRDLLGNIRKLKYSELELSFDKEVARLENRAERTLPAAQAAGVDLEIKNQLLSLAMTSPEAAVLEAWRLLESRLVVLADTVDLKVAPAVRVMPMVLGALLYREGKISEAQYSLLRRMRVLRNEASHSPQGSVDVEQASSFVKLAVRLSASLDPESAVAVTG